MPVNTSEKCVSIIKDDNNMLITLNVSYNDRSCCFLITLLRRTSRRLFKINLDNRLCI
jgi:hypothetical protein